MFKLSNVGLSGFEVEKKKRGGKKTPMLVRQVFFAENGLAMGEGVGEKLFFFLLITTFTTIERRK